mmetsp:Transcript_57308/g.174506  ORF Transcript_57308/g.174506 Transcript_57308/m.174506 type:complete len:284 (+) Transcript_57308:1149-2000(+)
MISSGASGGFNNSSSSRRVSAEPFPQTALCRSVTVLTLQSVAEESSPTTIHALKPAWSTSWMSARSCKSARTAGTCDAAAARWRAVAPLLSWQFGDARLAIRALIVSMSPWIASSIRAVLPSRPGPSGSARRLGGKEPLLNSPAMSCRAPEAVRLPGAMVEAYCCNRTVASTSYRAKSWILAMVAGLHTFLISSSMMYSTFSPCAQRKRSPMSPSASTYFNMQSKTVLFCMKAAKRSGGHRPKGMSPLSRCGSAPAAIKASIDLATNLPFTVGGVIAKKIRGV